MSQIHTIRNKSTSRVALSEIATMLFDRLMNDAKDDRYLASGESLEIEVYKDFDIEELSFNNVLIDFLERYLPLYFTEDSDSLNYTEVK